MGTGRAAGGRGGGGVGWFSLLSKNIPLTKADAVHYLRLTIQVIGCVQGV